MKHYVGEVGADVILETGLTITGATVAILVQKPDGTTASWSASVYGTTQVKHTLASGDFNTSGIYRMQASIVQGTHTFYGETFEMYVYDQYE